MDGIEYGVNVGVYWFVFSVLASPINIGLVFLARRFGGRDGPAAVNGAIIIVFLGMQLLAGYLARKAARHRAEGTPFVECIYDAVRELRVELSTLPLVGRLFAPRG